MYKSIVCRYHEIATKGHNRCVFEQRLMDNLQRALRRIGRKMKIRRMQTVVMTALFAMALFVSLAAMLDAPVYLPYREGRVTLAKTQDGALLLTFDEAVKDFRCTVYEDPNGGDFYCCDVSTWTSAWAERFAGERGGLSAVVATEQEKWYLENIVSRMEAGDIVFSGAYDEPDYELMTAGDIQLHIDRAQVEQVLINLLKNAREACARTPDPCIDPASRWAPPKPSPGSASSTCATTARASCPTCRTRCSSPSSPPSPVAPASA